MERDRKRVMTDIYVGNVILGIFPTFLTFEVSELHCRSYIYFHSGPWEALFSILIQKGKWSRPQKRVKCKTVDFQSRPKTEKEKNWVLILGCFSVQAEAKS